MEVLTRGQISKEALQALWAHHAFLLCVLPKPQEGIKNTQALTY